MLYTERLKDNKLFLRLYRRGSFTATELFTVYYLPNKQSFNRFGVAVGKKLGSAVKRNRAKRIMREAYRRSELSLPIGYDFVFVARSGIEGKKEGDVERLIRSRVVPDISRRASKEAKK